MSSSFALILVTVGAYLAAHVAFGWIARRFYIVSGAEYLLLGLLLGPEVSGLISASVVDGFAPFLTLSLGWVGVVVGAQFYLPELIRVRGTMYRIAFLEAILTLGIVTALGTSTFVLLLDVPVSHALVLGVAMGAIATASAPTGIALAARRLGGSGLVRQLQLTTAIDALVAITAFGLLLSIDHAPPPAAVRPPTPTEWVVISVALGCLGGALFHLFLGEETKIDRLFIALAGATILATGAAAYMRLSPLLPTLLIGAILINTSHSRVQIRQVLSTMERPIYFVLLIFAGAAWQPVGWTWVVPVLVFLLGRTFGKVAGGFFAAWANGGLPALGPTWGRALIGQGGLAVAIALNFRIHDPSPLPNVIFTAAIASVLLTDLTSARTVESVIASAYRRILGSDSFSTTERA